MENLFDNPTTLRNPDDFVGRKDLLRRIFSLLEARQSASLIGPRRIGKTSLLNSLRNPEIQQQFAFDGNQYLFLYLDLQGRAMKARVEFLDEICRVLKGEAQRLGFVVTEGLDRDDEFKELLDEFEQHDLYPVLMMDAFDEIARYQSISNDVFSVLRSAGSAGQVSYITASMKAVRDIIRKVVPIQQEESSPLYNILAPMRLTSFSTHEAHMYLVETSRKSGLPFTDDEVNWAVQLAGSHPFVLQQVATALFEEKRSFGAEKVDHDYIQEVVQQNLQSHFEDCWDVLSQTERSALVADAAKKNGWQEARENRMYPELCRNEFFRIYLRDTGHLDGVPPVFKDALEHFDNPVILGESSLGEKLPFLEQRIKQLEVVSTSVRGKVIQDVFREALKKMEGQGVRVDASRDWVHYNILHYRYFRQRRDMNQDVIASRLAISERQYYRLLPKAIEQLWKELLAMNAEAVLEAGD